MLAIKNRYIGFFFLWVLSISTAYARVETITILHTNDHHGHFMPFAAEKQTQVGGLAAQSTMVEQVRQEVGGKVLVLSAGDISTGIPESDLFDNEPDIKMMNIIGYDAMVLGNHEFDKPVSLIHQKQKWANFPFLSANVIDKRTHRSIVMPYIIKQVGDLKVAILGLTTEEAPILIQAENIKDLAFQSVIATAKRFVPILKQQADIVVALTHIGFFEWSPYLHAPGDIALAKAVKGIDVIVGGHTDTVLYEPYIVGETLIVQAGHWGKYVGRLDLQVDKEHKIINDFRYDLVPVNYVALGEEQGKYPKFAQDPKCTKIASSFKRKAAPHLSRTVGKTLVSLGVNRRENYVRETLVGNLVADAMREKTGADIAIQNAGGIRDVIEKGDISYRDILSVLPFSNTLVLMKLTGREILEILKFACSVPEGHGGFLQVSGIQWKHKKGKVKNVKVNGESLSLGKVYQVVTNNFVANGGDGYQQFVELEKLDTGLLLSDVVTEYISQKKVIEPKIEGRIIGF